MDFGLNEFTKLRLDTFQSPKHDLDPFQKPALSPAVTRTISVTAYNTKQFSAQFPTSNCSGDNYLKKRFQQIKENAKNDLPICISVQYHKHPYLQYTQRIPKKKKLGPLTLLFEKFSQFGNPVNQIVDIVTFDAIDKANHTLSLFETFIFAEKCGILKPELITKPEIMVLFSITIQSAIASAAATAKENKTKVRKLVSHGGHNIFNDNITLNGQRGDTVMATAYNTDYHMEMEQQKQKTRQSPRDEFYRWKSFNSSDLTEDHFPYFLTRLAIVMFSRPPLAKSKTQFTNVEKSRQFIKYFKLNDESHVKQLIRNTKMTANESKLRLRSPHEFLQKLEGLTNIGGNGLKKIERDIKGLLHDTDIFDAVQPFFPVCHQTLY